MVFDLKKFLVENRLTRVSQDRVLSEVDQIRSLPMTTYDRVLEIAAEALGISVEDFGNREYERIKVEFDHGDYQLYFEINRGNPRIFIADVFRKTSAGQVIPLKLAGSKTIAKVLQDLDNPEGFEVQVVPEIPKLHKTGKPNAQYAHERTKRYSKEYYERNVERNREYGKEYYRRKKEQREKGL